MPELYFRKTYNDFVDFISEAHDELIILSPYIKLEAIKALLEKIRPAIRVIVVARWKIGDLVFGSSDIEVSEYLKSLGHSFYVNQRIHLKVIVKDKKEILIGSANITGSGLGLFDDSNIEAIAIDSLDEKYLPPVYSILRESLLINDKLAQRISDKIVKYSDAKENRKQIEDELARAERSIFVKTKKNILVYDFPLTISAEMFLESINAKKIDKTIMHDLKLFGLGAGEISLSRVKHAFLNSDAYQWQVENIADGALFGKYSELLHNALMDDPKPYRKQVKELVANMFNWTEGLSDEY